MFPVHWLRRAMYEVVWCWRIKTVVRTWIAIVLNVMLHTALSRQTSPSVRRLHLAIPISNTIPAAPCGAVYRCFMQMAASAITAAQIPRHRIGATGTPSTMLPLPSWLTSSTMTGKSKPNWLAKRSPQIPNFPIFSVIKTARPVLVSLLGLAFTMTKLRNTSSMPMCQVLSHLVVANMSWCLVVAGPNQIQMKPKSRQTMAL